MTTINEVARAAGVSSATVSRALAQPDLLSAKTRAHVLDVIERLGYAPNATAAALRTTRTRKIIVTVPDISNPFFSRVIQGVEEAAQEMGYTVLLGDTRNQEEREEQYAAMLGRREADGFIFLGHRLPSTLARLIAREGHRAPIVNGCEFSPSLSVSSAHIDNAAAARAAVDALYDLGHRDVAVITGPLQSPLSRDRLVGAQRGAEARGLAARMQIAHGDFSLESGRRCTHELLNGAVRPTAIFCFSDEMAIGALSTLRSLGLQCPADVSIFGFDDIAMARYVDPPLTTMRQPMRQIGRQTVKLLVAIIDGTATAPVNVTLPHRLIVRHSVGPIAADRMDRE
jgi:LacI family repressor for deo operon, udp, cdd, tsx, nupC, and nupG